MSFDTTPPPPKPNKPSDSGDETVVLPPEPTPAAPTAESGPSSSKSFLVTWLLSLLVGYFGVDRFYLGKIGTGIVKLITFGGFGVWYLIDLIMVLTGNATDSQHQKVRGQGKQPLIAWVVTGLIVLLSLFMPHGATGSPQAGSVSTGQSVASAPAAATRQIVYSVTGDGGSASITYSSWSGGSWGSESANGAPLPWSKTVTPDASTSGSSFSSFSVFAMGTADTTSLNCTITVDGTVVSTKTSTGPFASVTCSKSSY